MTTPTLPNPDIQAILNKMVADADKNLKLQQERERQFQVRLAREEAIRAKKIIADKCRNILQG